MVSGTDGNGYGKIADFRGRLSNDVGEFPRTKTNPPNPKSFSLRHPEPCEGPKEGIAVSNSGHRSAVYILASRKNGTLYIGVTADLRTRIWQHKAGAIEGFAKQYRVTALVYFEEYRGVLDAIHREKTLKGWNRSRKVALIESTNPDWDDLAANWFMRSLGPSHGSG